MSQVEDKLKEMGIELQAPAAAAGNYVSAVRTGNLVYLAGVGPRKPDGELVLGKVGRELTVEQGYEAARWCAVALLGNLRREIGDLDNVVRFVKLLGMVNSDPEFTQPPAVMNGCSDLIVELYGDRGRHARSAVGMATLPNGMAVEVESIVEVRA
ncbi:MAG: RidA family protein [Dehalococcoidia bacterium]